MTLTESKCMSWDISDICSSKCIESSPFCVFSGKYNLTLEQKISEATQEDKFVMGLKSRIVRNIGSFSFLVKIFIQDKFNNIQFVQQIKLDERIFSGIFAVKCVYIWCVKRSDILAISECLNLPCLNFVILFSPLEKHRWIMKLEEKSKHQNGKDFADKIVQTDFDIATSCMKSLSEDFCNLLKNEAETDMILKCGNKTFPVHKIILSARSDVFAAMFRNNMSEKRDGVVEIRDTDPVILKEFLQYIYTGTLSDITDDTAPLLYATAHKYAVDALQARCGNFMQENLSEANACNHLILADAHDDSNLKNRIISFIRYNEEILSGEEWIKLCDGNPKLTIEVYRVLFKDISPAIP